MTNIEREWLALQAAACSPRYGCARRNRAALRAFVHAQLASESGAQQPLKLGNRGWWLAT